MRSSSPSAGKLSVREIALLPLMGALIFAAKEALYALPNININAVLIILCAVFFGWKGMFSVGIYVMLEGLVNGFHIWCTITNKHYSMITNNISTTYSMNTNFFRSSFTN